MGGFTLAISDPYRRRGGILFRFGILVFGAALLLLNGRAGAASSLKEKIIQKRHLLTQATLKEKSILRELEDLAREISKLGEEIRVLDGKIAATQQKIALLNRRLEDLACRERTLRENLSREIAVFSTLYRTLWLNLLFEPSKANEFLRRESYLRTIIQNESEKLKDLYTLRAELLRLKREKEEMLRELMRQKELREDKRHELLLARQEKEILLQRVRENKRLYREALEVLLAARREIEALSRQVEEARRELEKLKKQRSSPPPVQHPRVRLRPLFEVKGYLLPPVSGPVLRFFGLDRDLFTGKISFSPGIFIGARVGTRVRAPFAARVTRLKWIQGQGQMVVLDHGYGFVSLIGGLSEVKVLPGQEVSTGEVLGRVGASPFGPSGVYYELRYRGKPQNPLEWLNIRELKLAR
ncbi:peptidoglycan DD-metalloendopeptidase family protein [Thermosulfurimonas sp.]|uniref:murein hydrolase activator EnvC family protein n=1 Tax=Thermosulfurimonas sp. TaxID=2080236 RepID=UPI0025E305C1|nr:peptidoglycan DD-metalloendopeptidase family protein [Thermosulfurimonas sp.]